MVNRTRASSRTTGRVCRPWDTPPGLIGKCLRTILHLITWLSANGTGIETLDIRVLHQFLNHDCACPGPRGYRKNLERARWHLHRFLGFLMETGQVRMPAEIETGARVVESFLQTLVAQGYVHESIAAYGPATVEEFLELVFDSRKSKSVVSQ